jgi:N-acetylmuramoyl-L-alanine amidase
MRRQSSDPDSYIHAPFLLALLRNNAPLLLFLIVSLISMFAVYQFYNVGSDEAAQEASSFSGEVDFERRASRVVPISKEINKLPVSQRRAQSPGPTHIGLIAGHRGFDSGTSCADGFTEVQITDAVTERVAANLRLKEIDTETLDEFDPQLDNYAATALISIHVDSCDFINEFATGYKIAGSPYTDSSQLSICVEQMYGKSTMLPYHPNSITPHMANYHAFNKISQGTPAIIIEIGFLNLDRQILTQGSDVIVDGLVEGITCFLEQSQ